MSADYFFTILSMPLVQTSVVGAMVPISKKMVDVTHGPFPGWGSKPTRRGPGAGGGQSHKNCFDGIVSQSSQLTML